MEETKILVECCYCNGSSVCVPDDSLDESKFEISFCPFCGNADVETEELV